ncbi:hypothetical protein, conserved [Eimeria necatrix]|uniref:RAVE complex protein Rav1 C-terminal domain-containing protein n=1 Tax=Eimeria necatrix TaxID=51315 RepID=U6MXE4_9EIME|nr:hypothetical protein, conserved [Eimeria necatrix]CDJ67164.1 hypothetical protein, conserved [Eimeria necatrix]
MLSRQSVASHGGLEQQWSAAAVPESSQSSKSSTFVQQQLSSESRAPAAERSAAPSTAAAAAAAAAPAAADNKQQQSLSVSSLVGALVPLPVRPPPSSSYSHASFCAAAPAAAAALPPLVRIVAVSALLTSPTFCCSQAISQAETAAAAAADAAAETAARADAVAAAAGSFQKGSSNIETPEDKQPQQQEAAFLGSAGAETAAETSEESGAAATAATAAATAATLQHTVSATLTDDWLTRGGESAAAAAAAAAAGAGAGGPFVYAAAIHDCVSMCCSSSSTKQHAALRRCVFLLQVPWQLTVRFVDRVTAARSFAAAAAAVAPAAPAPRCSSSWDDALPAWCRSSSSHDFLKTMLGPGASRMPCEVRCVPLLPAAAAVGSRGDGALEGCCSSSSQHSSHRLGLGICSNSSNNSLSSLASARGVLGPFKCVCAASTTAAAAAHQQHQQGLCSIPLSARALPLVLQDRCSSSSCCCSKSLRLGPPGVPRRPPDLCYCCSATNSSNCCGGVRLLQQAKLLCCCQHTEYIVGAALLGPSAVSPLLLLATGCSSNTYLWSLQSPTLLQLCGRIYMPPLQPQQQEDQQQEVQQYKYALLESDERQLQHSRVAFGFESSSPFAAVPNMHVLFVYLPWSHQQQQQQQQRCVVGAFIVDGLARGARGLPSLQQVAAADEIPLSSFHVDDISEVVLAEPNLWSDMMCISVSSASELDNLLGAPGAVLGAAVFSGVPLAAGSIAATPALLHASLPAGSGLPAAAASAAAAPAAETPQLLWGALSGFLSCLIPPCRMRVLTAKGDELLLLLSPVLLRIPKDSSGSSSKALQVRYAVRCLASSSLLTELPALRCFCSEQRQQQQQQCPVEDLGVLEGDTETFTGSNASSVEAEEGGSPSAAAAAEASAAAEGAPGAAVSAAATAETKGGLLFRGFSSLPQQALDLAWSAETGLLLLWSSEGLRGGVSPLLSLQSAALQQQRQLLLQQPLQLGCSPASTTHLPVVSWASFLPASFLALLQHQHQQQKQFQQQQQQQRQEGQLLLLAPTGRLPLVLCAAADGRQLLLLQVDPAASVLGVQQLQLLLLHPERGEPVGHMADLNMEAIVNLFTASQQQFYEQPQHMQQQQQKQSQQALLLAAQIVELPLALAFPDATTSLLLLLTVSLPPRQRQQQQQQQQVAERALWLLVFAVDSRCCIVQQQQHSHKVEAGTGLALSLVGAWRDARGAAAGAAIGAAATGALNFSSSSFSLEGHQLPLQQQTAATVLTPERLAIVSPFWLQEERLQQQQQVLRSHSVPLLLPPKEKTVCNAAPAAAAAAAASPEHALIYCLRIFASPIGKRPSATDAAASSAAAGAALSLLAAASIPGEGSRIRAVSLQPDSLVLQCSRTLAAFVFSLRALPLLLPPCAACIGSSSSSSSEWEQRVDEGLISLLMLQPDASLSAVLQRPGAAASSASFAAVALAGDQAGDVSSSLLPDGRLAVLVKSQQQQQQSAAAAAVAPYDHIAVYLQDRVNAAAGGAAPREWLCVFASSRSSSSSTACVYDAWWSSDGSLLVQMEAPGAAESSSARSSSSSNSFFCFRQLSGELLTAARGVIPVAVSAGSEVWGPAPAAAIEAFRAEREAAEQQQQQQVHAMTAAAAAINVAMARARQQQRQQQPGAADVQQMQQLQLQQKLDALASVDRTTQNHGSCCMYSPEVLQQLLRCGYAATARWLLLVLLRCLLAAGLPPTLPKQEQQEAAAEAARPDAPSSLESLTPDAEHHLASEAGEVCCCICGAAIAVGPARAAAGAAAGTDGAAAAAVCADCQPKTGCELARLLQQAMAAAGCLLTDLISQQQAAQYQQDLLQNQELTAAEQHRLLQQRRCWPRTSAAYVQWAQRCLPSSLQPSPAVAAAAGAVAAAAGPESHLTQSLLSARGDSLWQQQQQQQQQRDWMDRVGGGLSGSLFPAAAAASVTAGAAAATNSRAKPAAFGLFGPGDEGPLGASEDDPFDVRALLGLDTSKEAPGDTSQESSEEVFEDRPAAPAASAAAGGTAAAVSEAAAAGPQQAAPTAAAAVLMAPVRALPTNDEYEQLLQLLQLPLPGLALPPQKQLLLRCFIRVLQQLDQKQQETLRTAAAAGLAADFPAAAGTAAAAAADVADAARQFAAVGDNNHSNDANTSSTPNDIEAAAREVAAAAATAAKAAEGSLQSCSTDSSRQRFYTALLLLREAELAVAEQHKQMQQQQQQQQQQQAAQERQQQQLQGTSGSTFSSPSSSSSFGRPPLSGAAAPSAAAAALPAAALLSSEDICWCLHAAAEEDLMQQVVQQAREAHPERRLVWPHLRLRGVGFWLRSPSTVRQLCDFLLADAVQLAAAEQQQQQQGSLNFRGSGEEGTSPLPTGASSATAGAGAAQQQQGPSAAAAASPSDLVALWAAVSGKKSLIVASFKAQGNAKVVEFLQSDFADPRWRSAAERNAFRLLTHRRPFLALAFFCLACSYREIADVCCRLLTDTQLALFLCRVGAAVSSPGAPPLGTDYNTGALQQQQQQQRNAAAASGSRSDSSGLAAAAADGAAADAAEIRGDFPPSPLACDGSPAAEYSRVLLQRLLPTAAAEGDIWLRFCCYWLAGHYSKAFDALLPPYAGALQQQEQQQPPQQPQQQQQEVLPFNPRTYLQGVQQQQLGRPSSPFGNLPAERTASAAGAASGGGAAAAAAEDDRVYEGGCWRVASPSLSLILFRAAIKQTLPMRRAQQKHKEKHLEQQRQQSSVLESFYGVDDSMRSRCTSRTSSSSSCSRSSSKRWGSPIEGSRTAFAASGSRSRGRRFSRTDSFFASLRDLPAANSGDSSSNNNNSSSRARKCRICWWGFVDPAGAAESDMYLLSCLYTRDRQPFLAAVAAVSLLSLRASRCATLKALDEVFSPSSSEEAPEQNALLPDAALPTIWGALHAFAAAAAPPLLYSAALQQQQQHQGPSAASVFRLLDLQPSLLLLLTAPAWQPSVGAHRCNDSDNNNSSSSSSLASLLRNSTDSQHPQVLCLPTDVTDNALLMLLSSLDLTIELYSQSALLLLSPLLSGIRCSRKALLSHCPFRPCCSSSAATAAAAAEEVQEALSLPAEANTTEGPNSGSSTPVLTPRSQELLRGSSGRSLQQAAARLSLSLCLRVAAPAAAAKRVARCSSSCCGSSNPNHRSSNGGSATRLQCPWAVHSALFDLLQQQQQRRGARRLLAAAAKGASPSSSSQSLAAPEGPLPGSSLETETDSVFVAVSSQLVALAHAQLLAAAEAAADARRITAAAAALQNQQQQALYEEGSFSISAAVAGLILVPSCSTSAAAATGDPAAGAAAAADDSSSHFGMPVLLPLLLQLLRDTLEMPSIHPKVLGVPALYCCLSSCVSELQQQLQQECCCCSCSSCCTCSCSSDSGCGEAALSLLELRRLYSVSAACCCGLALSLFSCMPSVFSSDSSMLLQHMPSAATASAAAAAAAAPLGSEGPALKRSSSSIGKPHAAVLSRSNSSSNNNKCEEDRMLSLAHQVAKLLQLILSRPRCLLLQQDVLKLLQQILEPRWVDISHTNAAAAERGGAAAAAAASAPAFALAACVAVRVFEFLVEATQAVQTETQRTAVALLGQQAVLLQQHQQQAQQQQYERQPTISNMPLQHQQQDSTTAARATAAAAAAAAAAEEAYSLCSSFYCLNSSLVEFLGTQLRPVFMRSLLPAAAGLLPLLCDSHTHSTSAAAAAGSAAARRTSMLSAAAESWGGRGMGCLWDDLCCCSRMQWALQQTSFLPLQQLPPPALLRPLLHRNSLLQAVRHLTNRQQQQHHHHHHHHVDHHQQQQQQQKQQHVHPHSHSKDGQGEDHVLQLDELQEQIENKHLQQQQQQHFGPDAAHHHNAAARERHAATPSCNSPTPRGSSRRFSSCFPTQDKGQQQENQQQQQHQQVISSRVAEHMLAATCLPAVPVVAAALFPGWLVQAACSSSNGSNAFEVVRHSHNLKPLQQQQQQQQQRQQEDGSIAALSSLVQDWAVLPLGALLGSVIAACSCSSSSRHTIPAGLSVSGDVVASVSTSEGPPRGLRSLSMPLSLLGLATQNSMRCAAAVAAAAATAEGRYRDAARRVKYQPLQQQGEQQQQTEAAAHLPQLLQLPLVSDICGPGGAFPCLLRSHRPLYAVGAAKEAAETAAASGLSREGSEDCVLQQQQQQQQLQQLLHRQAGAVGVAEWVGMLLSRDVSLYTVTQTSRLCAYSRLLARVTDSSSSSSSSSSSPVFPYGVFSPLSAMRSAFEFTGVIAAHPFLPIFAALLRAPQGQTEKGGPSVITPVLRPFGSGARSLPRSPPAAAAAAAAVAAAAGSRAAAADSAAAAAAAASDKSGSDVQRLDTLERSATEVHEQPLQQQPQQLQRQQSGKKGLHALPLLLRLQQQQVGPSGQARAVAASLAAAAANEVTCAAWVPQGDSILVCDAAGWAYLFCLLRGPLLSPSLVAEALSASAAAAAAAAQAVASATARPAAADNSLTPASRSSSTNMRSSNSASYDLQQQRACRPALCWRPHTVTQQIAAADGSGAFAVTLGVGLPQQLLQQDTSLIAGAAGPRSLLQRLGSGETACGDTGAPFVAGSNHCSSSSSRGALFRSKFKKRPNALKLFGSLRTTAKEGVVSRLLHSRFFAFKFPAAAALQQQRRDAAAAPAAPFVGGAPRALSWRARAFRISSRGSRGLLRGLGGPMSANGSTKGAGAPAKQRQQRPQQQQQHADGEEDEEAWFDSAAWTASLWGLGSSASADCEGSAESSGVHTPDSSSRCSMPAIEGPCFGVWQLTSVGPSGGPRLISVITCDDLLQTRARLANSAAAPAAGKAAKKQAAAAGEGSTWSVEATHIPTCFCMAVLQEGPACCTACLAAAAGCSGSCCSSNLTSTCCGGSCAALRCVVYGDTEGTVHAVDLGLEEEVLRWEAHRGSSIVSVSVSRASGWGSAAPEVWLVTAAAAGVGGSSSSSEGTVLRCWSIVGLGEGGPVLLHQLHVSADAVMPPGVSARLSAAPGRGAAAAAAPAAAAAAAGGSNALARLLGAYKTADTEEHDKDQQATVFSLGGRSSLVVEGGDMLLLARV